MLEAVRRVTARRVEHVADLLVELRVPAVAQRRAAISLAAAVGADQLADVLPTSQDRRALVATALEMAPAPA